LKPRKQIDHQRTEALSWRSAACLHHDSRGGHDGIE
jgi:hypothetical protein